jgi:hypothetical protein
MMAHWLCTGYFKDRDHTNAVDQLLLELDSQPQLVDAHFNGLKHLPMGKYFEQLLFFLLNNDPRYEIVLTNHQVIENGRTIGELDLIVRDTANGLLEHWEICLKYYLRSATSNDLDDIIGPNAKDRLRRKFDKLISHQLPLSKRTDVTQILNNQIAEPKLFMKGQLFDHLSRTIAFPSVIHPNIDKGWWCHLHEAEAKLSTEFKWVIVEKPNWIGPFSCQEDDLVSALQARNLIKNHFDTTQSSLLVIGLKPQTDHWVEHTRGFVVNNNWPNITLSH